MPQQSLMPGFDPEPIAMDGLLFALLPDADLAVQMGQRMRSMTYCSAQ